jgi:hypothetical protein
MRIPLIAIGRHQYADHSLVLEKPLSSEFKGLIIRLMALEIGSRAFHRGAIHDREAAECSRGQSVAIARQAGRMEQSS